MQIKRITRMGSLLLLVSILAACLLSGCDGAKGGIDQSVLTQEQREAISAAYAESKNGAPRLYWFQTDGLGAYYLGEIEGCIIFYNLRTWDPNIEYGDITDMLWPPEEQNRTLRFRVAGVTFSPGFWKELYAYKDGEVLLLSMAWVRDWIRKEDVEQIEKAYDSFIRHLVEMGEKGYIKREKQFQTLIYGKIIDDKLILNESREYRLFMKELEKQGG